MSTTSGRPADRSVPDGAPAARLDASARLVLRDELNRFLQLPCPTPGDTAKWHDAVANLAVILHARVGDFPPRPTDLDEPAQVVRDLFDLEVRICDAHCKLAIWNEQRSEDPSAVRPLPESAANVGTDKFQSYTIVRNVARWSPATFARLQAAIGGFVVSLIGEPPAERRTAPTLTDLYEPVEVLAVPPEYDSGPSANSATDPPLTAALLADQLAAEYGVSIDAKSVSTFLSRYRQKNPNCAIECKAGNGARNSQYLYLRSAVWTGLQAFANRRAASAARGKNAEPKKPKSRKQHPA